MYLATIADSNQGIQNLLGVNIHRALKRETLKVACVFVLDGEWAHSVSQQHLWVSFGHALFATPCYICKGQ